MSHKDIFNRIGRSLHWLVAIGFIALSLVGIYMANVEAWALYPVHKSMGILLLSAILLRVCWRLWRGWPESAVPQSRIERMLAKIVHRLLLVGTVLMPVSGMFYSGASGHGFGLFGWQLVAENPDPQRPGQVLAYDDFWSALGEQVHEIAGYLLVAAVLLHIAAALKHQWIAKQTRLRQVNNRGSC
ncbi:cytochrome b [Rheinheimera riviphila]|uniref:Cytochrome b n=1 Tax=Rheinheimera riviphila TaxID=1834037 RepID=A0A437QIC0_9GAMM|nr:cytochrome b [Rheinheimera riviphila]RVU34307.1 cytochrome b [Rheinheimera riviphila]